MVVGVCAVRIPLILLNKVHGAIVEMPELRDVRIIVTEGSSLSEESFGECEWSSLSSRLAGAAGKKFVEMVLQLSSPHGAAASLRTVSWCPGVAPMAYGEAGFLPLKPRCRMKKHAWSAPVRYGDDSCDPKVPHPSKARLEIAGSNETGRDDRVCNVKK